MIPLTGYADRLSVRPDETISFHVSYHPIAGAKPVEAKVVRVINADPHGAGVQTEPVEDAVVDCVATPEPHGTQLGSHAEVDLPEDVLTSMTSQNGFSFSVTILPTLLGTNKQTIACVPSVFELFIDKDGTLGITFGTNGEVLSTEKALRVNQWVAVSCIYEDGEAALAWQLEGVAQSEEHSATKDISNIQFGGGQSLLLACRERQDGDSQLNKYYDQHFNGRMEHPKLWCTTSGPNQVANASWDFGLEMTSQRIMDVGPNKLHGKLINAPTRGVRGSNWTGREMCWRHAPDEYAAIHFHSTDFSDCQWPVCYQWEVPSGLKSGNYALLLNAGEGEADNIPFFVVPPKGQKQADVAVLVSTFTYVIYGNHARGEWVDDPKWEAAWKEQLQQNPTAYPYNPREHPEYGWSTYNNHADGSGVCLATWLRPILNLRLGYITFPYPESTGSGLRHYPADTHLTAWLEGQGISYDIVTDWELHTEGSQVLKPYRVVMTGSHPEYHSEASLKALRGYKDSGGRLMYLGGNGFYWKIAVSGEDSSSLLEIRRGEGGVRAWASDPGEYYHQLDGQYGGLWRRNGRAPQELAGVGFTAQGNFEGSFYRIRNNEKLNPRVAWMLKGIDTETIGKHGLSGHGAAGFELDRMDVSLGTPDHAVVVASSEGHNLDGPWILVFEERLTHHGNLVGVPDKELIRADITFFETPSGGAVFSTGSITYCGSLLTNSGNNDISTLTKNVLLKFLDQGTAFVVPS